MPRPTSMRSVTPFEPCPRRGVPATDRTTSSTGPGIGRSLTSWGDPSPWSTTSQRIWEGHLEQYTNGKVPEVEAARNGIFRNDFITQFDWEHTSEELASFYLYALARPNDPTNKVRAQRMAGLYLNEDPAAQNYDPEAKVIRSLFNGSLGPRLTPVAPVDWEGLSPSLRFWSVAATERQGRPSPEHVGRDAPLHGLHPDAG